MRGQLLWAATIYKSWKRVYLHLRPEQDDVDVPGGPKAHDFHLVVFGSLKCNFLLKF